MMKALKSIPILLAFLILAACGQVNGSSPATPPLSEANTGLSEANTGQTEANTGQTEANTNVESSDSVAFVFDGERSIEVFGSGYPLTVRDYLDVETDLESRPQRAAVLSGTPMNIWYDLGGKSVCTANISDNLKLLPQYRDELLTLPTIGQVFSVNMEAIIEQEPDLIVAQFGTQNIQAVALRNMGYNVITTNIRSFDDVISAYLAFGKILEVEELAEAKAMELIWQRDDLLSKSPQDGKTTVILYLTANTLSVKLNNSIAGDIALSLGLQNIAADLPADSIGGENALLDIEYVIDKDPDIVLVTSMIADNVTAILTMEGIFADSPIWQGVRAVREGRVVYLPQEYFLYNAGPFYNEAVEYMARSVYPEIYGEAGEWYESKRH